MFSKVVGIVLAALPGAAGFAAYGIAQSRGMSPLASAGLAGLAFVAGEYAGQTVATYGISGLAFENVGLLVNPARRTRAIHSAYNGSMGYLAPQRVGACFGSC
jgi:hypothetical protein